MSEPNFGEAVRIAMLTVTLAELCHLDVDTVKSPTCPFCNEGPAMALPAGQAFCGNDDCSVFTWQITDTPEEFRRQAKPVRIQTRNPDGTWQEETDD